MLNEFHTLKDALQEAGAKALDIVKKEKIIITKGYHGVVTKVDLAVNTILQNQLQHVFPDYGWLSEETYDDKKRLQHKRVWIVDPIDGTKELIMGLPEFSISVALIQDHIPILGGVFNPSTNELFMAIKNHGSFLNSKRIFCTEKSTAAKPIILVSRSEFVRGEWTFDQDQYFLKPLGSIAYKLSLVAAGQAQASISLGPKYEWDIAAGVLLVEEAKGFAVNKGENKIIFNQEKAKTDGIIAGYLLDKENILNWIKNHKLLEKQNN